MPIAEVEQAVQVAVSWEPRLVNLTRFVGNDEIETHVACTVSRPASAAMSCPAAPTNSRSTSIQPLSAFLESGSTSAAAASKPLPQPALSPPIPGKRPRTTSMVSTVSSSDSLADASMASSDSRSLLRSGRHAGKVYGVASASTMASQTVGFSTITEHPSTADEEWYPKRIAATSSSSSAAGSPSIHSQTEEDWRSNVVDRPNTRYPMVEDGDVDDADSKDQAPLSDRRLTQLEAGRRTSSHPPSQREMDTVLASLLDIPASFASPMPAADSDQESIVLTPWQPAMARDWSLHAANSMPPSHSMPPSNDPSEALLMSPAGADQPVQDDLEASDEAVVLDGGRLLFGFQHGKRSRTVKQWLTSKRARLSSMQISSAVDPGPVEESDPAAESDLQEAKHASSDRTIEHTTTNVQNRGTRVGTPRRSRRLTSLLADAVGNQDSTPRRGAAARYSFAQTPSREPNGDLSDQQTPSSRYFGLRSRKSLVLTSPERTPRHLLRRRRQRVVNGLHELRDHIESDEDEAPCVDSDESAGSRSESDAENQDVNQTPSKKWPTSRTLTSAKSFPAKGIRPSLENDLKTASSSHLSCASALNRSQPGSPSSVAEDASAGEDELAPTLKSGQFYFEDILRKRNKSRAQISLTEDIPELSVADFHRISDLLPVQHSIEKKNLWSLHREHFDAWLLHMDAQFNLLFYGIGSKRRLLNEFVTENLQGCCVATINGFDPSFQLRQFLLNILVGLLDHQGSATGSILTLSNRIVEILQNEAVGCPFRGDLYIVLHNLDGQALRNEKAQNCISTLASCRRVHLLASVDHIQALFLFSPSNFDQYNFLFHDLTTYDDCQLELSYFGRGSILASFLSDFGSASVRGAVSVQSVLNVLKSLTSNARSIFRIIVQHQVAASKCQQVTESAEGDRKSNPVFFDPFVGLTYYAFYEKCREQFLTTCDANFRHQLTEFRDHDMVAVRSLADGEVFHVPLRFEELEEILDQM